MFEYKDEKLYMHIGGVQMSGFYMKRVDGFDADLLLVEHCLTSSIIVKDSLLKAEFVSMGRTWLTLTTPVTSEEIAEMKRIASEMPQFIGELHFTPSMPSPQEIEQFAVKFSEGRLSLDVGGASLKEYIGLCLIPAGFGKRDVYIHEEYDNGLSVCMDVNGVMTMKYSFDEPCIRFDARVAKEQFAKIQRIVSVMPKGYK